MICRCRFARQDNVNKRGPRFKRGPLCWSELLYTGNLVDSPIPDEAVFPGFELGQAGFQFAVQRFQEVFCVQVLIFRYFVAIDTNSQIFGHLAAFHNIDAHLL